MRACRRARHNQTAPHTAQCCPRNVWRLRVPHVRPRSVLPSAHPIASLSVPPPQMCLLTTSFTCRALLLSLTVTCSPRAVILGKRVASWLYGARGRDRLWATRFSIWVSKGAFWETRVCGTCSPGTPSVKWNPRQLPWKNDVGARLPWTGCHGPGRGAVPWLD